MLKWRLKRYSLRAGSDTGWVLLAPGDKWPYAVFNDGYWRWKDVVRVAGVLIRAYNGAKGLTRST